MSVAVPTVSMTSIMYATICCLMTYMRPQKLHLRRQTANDCEYERTVVDLPKRSHSFERGECKIDTLSQSNRTVMLDDVK